MNLDGPSDETGEVLDVAVRSETSSEEKIIWVGRPDTDSMALPLLPFPICWLSGLFLFSVGVLQSTTDDTSRVLIGMIFLLVVVAAMGVIEILAVPWQAKRSIYVITDTRTFILKLRGKFGYSGMTDYSIVTRRLVRGEKGTLMFYFCYTIPIHVIFCYLVFDLVAQLAQQVDFFVVSGIGLIVVGWLYQWYADLRYPFPQFRECPRAFYFINEWLATVEGLPHELVKKTVLHDRRSGCGDIFLVAPGKGCMRMKSVPQSREVYNRLAELIDGSKGKSGSE